MDLRIIAPIVPAVVFAIVASAVIVRARRGGVTKGIVWIVLPLAALGLLTSLANSSFFWDTDRKLFLLTGSLTLSLLAIGLDKRACCDALLGIVNRQGGNQRKLEIQVEGVPTIVRLAFLCLVLVMFILTCWQLKL